MPLPQSHLYFWVFLVVGGVVYVTVLVGSLVFGDRYPRLAEAGRFAMDGVESLPFLGLALLAYAGETREDLRVLTLAYWLLLVGLFALVILGLAIFCYVDPAVLHWQGGPNSRRPDLFLPGNEPRMAVVGVGIIASICLGLLGLTPMMRRAMSHGLPFDEHSFVHAVALATVLAMTAMLLMPLAVIGEPVLLVLMRNFKDFIANNNTVEMSDQSVLRDQIYGTVWLVPAAIMAVGYPLHRSLKAALVRVGLVIPWGSQVIFALVAAVLLVVVMTFFDFGVDRLWHLLGWRTTDQKGFEELMKSAISPLGAAVIGITAGLGEELFARGVLQPRLGILLSNLFFTSLHALQYNWDGLLSVFVTGMILGYIRRRTNTTTSAIVHGTFDFLLILMSYYAIDPTKW